MDKYLEAEKRLAELLGWAAVEYQSAYQRLIGRPPTKIERTSVPRWTRDNYAAFALAVKQDVWPYTAFPVQRGEHVLISWNVDICIPVNDHPDKETAVRYAIVMAVIAKLEAERVKA